MWGIDSCKGMSGGDWLSGGVTEKLNPAVFSPLFPDRAALRSRRSRNMSCSVDYVALCAAGLHDLCVEEIERTCGLAAGSTQAIAVPPAADQWASNAPTGLRVFPGLAGVAKLRFTLRRPVDYEGWAAQRTMLASLKTVQCLLALVGTTSGVPMEKDEGPAWVAAAAQRSTGWESAFATWAAWGTARPLRPTFRASCVRDGQHAFTSMAVAQALGAAVGQMLGLRAAMAEYEAEVVAIVLQRELLLGINLSASRTGYSRGALPAEPRPLMPHADATARLRLSTASLLLALARVRAGDVVIDPMCGLGTIPLEAVATRGSVLALAGDADPASLSQAAANARCLHAARRSAASAGVTCK